MCIFNIYASRMLLEDARVVSNFIFETLKGELLTTSGDGSQIRSFCYFDDLVEGMIRLMNGSHIGPLNIGNLGEFSIRQLAELVGCHFNNELTSIEKPWPVDYALQRKSIINLVQDQLGWRPTVSLEEGLEPTFFCFHSLLEKRINLFWQ